MIPRRSLLLLMCLVAVVAAPLFAVTYIVPQDRDLIARADGIVIATAISSHSELRDAGRIVTVSELRVEETLKGNAGDVIRIVEPGGTVGNLATMIPGAPRYDDGKRYLIFLANISSGELATFGFGLGRFEFDGELLVRGDEVFGYDERDGRPHAEPLRDAAKFLGFVRSVAAASGAPARDDYFVDASNRAPEFRPQPNAFVPATNATRPDYLSSGNFRWQNGGVATIVYCCSSDGFQPGLDGPGAFASALANWNGAGTSVNYGNGGDDETATGGIAGFGGGNADRKNCVLFNDPSNYFGAAGVPSGVAGVGGISSAVGSYPLADGFTYASTQEVDVIIARGLSTTQATFVGVVTHELGHTLGFRHADQTAANDPLTPCSAPLPCSSSAIMTSVVGFNLSTLRQYDRDAIQTVYGSGPTCTPPSVSSQPQNVTITSGQQTTLSVAASGTTPLTFQWFIGSSGNTATPISGATLSQVTVNPTTTTNYWVQVSGQCAPVANSTTATVTVNPGTCPTVSVSVPSATPQGGGAFALSATASGGSGFTFQWFQGPASGSGTPIGSGNPFVVTPLATTTYWVRVTNSCNNTADSATVTVTIGCPTVSVPNPSAVPQNNGGFLLSVSPSGGTTFTFQWLLDNGTAVGSGNPFFVNPTSTTTYFARVTNECGNHGDSPTITINVVGGCTPPSIIGEPQNQTVTAGGTVTLTVSFFGNASTVTWFQGVPPDKSHPVGVGQTITSPPIAANTSFWAEIINNCGTAQTRAAAITVSAGCTPPSISGATATPPSIADGQSTTLTAAATGTSLGFQWFRGNVGDTSNPVPGGNVASVVVTPTVTTSYWVQVTSGCGAQAANGGFVVVQVSCAPVSFTLPPAITIGSGDSATIHLTVAGSQPLHVSWFRGQPVDTSHPVGTDSATLNTGPLTTNTTFWAHVQNDCLAVNTPAITVNVKAVKHRAVRH